jgi:hypothetical protein
MSASASFRQMARIHGRLVNRGVVTYRGQKAIELRDVANGFELYVAAEGTPYPLAYIQPVKRGSPGATVFSRWNKVVMLRAPKRAVDLSRLG